MATQGDELKLLGFWASPYSRRVEWALKLKGVAYEYIEEDIFNKSSLLLELNPVHKKIPVLVHNGKVANESILILEYVEEVWKQNPLLPQDPYQRAMARFWAQFGDQKLMNAAYNAMCLQGDEKDKAVQLTIEAMEKVEEELKGKKFFGGESIGCLDLVLGWISYWLPVWEEVGSMQILNPYKFPSITAWMNVFLNHPVIADNGLPDRDKMLVYFHDRRVKIASMNLGWIKF